jgi:hypothetical protein
MKTQEVCQDSESAARQTQDNTAVAEQLPEIGPHKLFVKQNVNCYLEQCFVQDLMIRYCQQ